MSKRCNTCGVYVTDDLCHCPLCGKYVGESAPCATAYIPTPVESSRASDVLDVMNGVCLIAVLISIIVNFVTIDLSNLMIQDLWCLYVAVGVADLCLVILPPILKRRWRWSAVGNLVCWSSVTVLVVDLISDGKINWSLQYVLPYTMVALSSVMAMIFLLDRHTEAANAALSQLIAFVGSLCVLAVVLVMRHFGLLNDILSAFIAAAVSTATFFALLVFRFKDYVAGLVRKFNA